jgi:creatinine deaminase
MCSGLVILFKISRVLIGENRTYQGAESWMEQNGIKLKVIDNETCINLMKRMQQERPDLWAEDIGE